MEQSLVMLALLQLLNEESDKSLDKETLLSQLGITEELLKICIEQLALLNCKIKVEGETLELEDPVDLLDQNYIYRHVKGRGRVEVLPSVDSTNTYMLNNSSFLVSGDTVIAEIQTAGRGRRGGKWHSSLGKQLTLSICYEFDSLDKIEGLSVGIGVAVAKAVEKLVEQDVLVKWPNDMNVQVLPPLSCGEAIKTCFRKFCVCSGRARRSEYWYFYLLCSIIMIIPISLYIYLVFKVSTEYTYRDRYRDFLKEGDLAIIIVVYLLLLVIAFSLIPVTVRRLHDTGKSWIYYFVNCIPCVGGIMFLMFLVEDSHQYTNEYGPSPKYVQVENNPLIINQQVPVNGIPTPNYQYPQGYPQAYPYQQNPQAPVQNNLYQEPMPIIPPEQAQIVTPIVAP